MEKINWGIIGLGNIAHEFSKAFAQINNAKLLAISSKDANKLKKFSQQFNVESKFSFKNYQDLINCDEVDIVYIALPNSFHKQWILKAIENNKYVTRVDIDLSKCILRYMVSLHRISSQVKPKK